MTIAAKLITKAKALKLDQVSYEATLEAWLKQVSTYCVMCTNGGKYIMSDGSAVIQTLDNEFKAARA